MRFKILHEIEYRYSSPVSLEPHAFYLKPRENRGQKLLSFDFSIDPAPRLRSDVVDFLGNDSIRAWFEGKTSSLSIRAESAVELDRPNPFDYLVDPLFAQLPVRYASSAVPKSVSDFSAAVAAQTGSSILLFLPELCRSIASSFEKLHRAEGEPWPSAKVLADKQGACRDLTVLFMDCCRAQGLATRFTSGYFEGNPDTPENELHAWAEVYVEGGGWRGFDPTAGLAVAESHVAIASSSVPAQVSPVIGAFRGEAQSSLKTRVQIQRA